MVLSQMASGSLEMSRSPIDLTRSTASFRLAQAKALALSLGILVITPDSILTPTPTSTSSQSSLVSDGARTVSSFSTPTTPAFSGLCAAETKAEFHPQNFRNTYLITTQWRMQN